MSAFDCTCQPCSMCGGRGFHYVDLRGRIVQSRCDDLTDTENCEECNGNGTTGECDHCRDLREQDEAQDDQSRL